MFKKLAFNEIKQNKFSSFTITLFVLLTTFLLSLAIIVSVTLVGNINKLMEVAKTPHYMQMHSGEIDSDKLDRFVNNQKIIKEHQLLEFINFEDWDFVVDGEPLDGGVQDNGVVKQADYFDYLLGENGEILNPGPSEIYVPDMYLRKDIIQIGDRVKIKSKEFIVKGVLYDSQMSSPLSSSKRFLINDRDFEELKKHGKTEYLVEFRLNSLDDITDMENAYIKSGLGKNGPALTYSMFKFINYISDSTLILILLVSSFFTLLISFLAIKLTVLVNIEEGIKDIGILRAIGIENKSIKKLYRNKFILLSIIGSILGAIIALLTSPLLLSNIKVIIDVNRLFKLNIMAIVSSAVIVFAFVMIFLEIMLYKINKITFTEAYYYTGGSSKKKSKKKSILKNRLSLSANKFMAHLGYGNLRSYSTLIKVIVLCTMLINFPITIYNSLSSDDIVSSMGIGRSDIMVSIKSSDNMVAYSKSIGAALKSDKRIADYSLLETRTYETILDNGNQSSLLIETGDLKKFPIKCSSGDLPSTEKEIAISSIVASQYGKKLGDSLKVKTGGKIVELSISGIYSDITNGGKTAKGIFKNNDESIMWVNIPAVFESKVEMASVINEYQSRFKEASIKDVEYYISKTFGVILGGIKKLVVGALLFGLLITLLISVLYFNLLVSKEKYQVNIQRVLGFSFSDIFKQYRLRMFMVMCFSVVAGTIFSGLFSGLFLKVIFSLFGVSSFVFKVNFLMTIVVVPIAIILVAILTLINTNYRLYKNKIIDSIKEV